MTSVEAQLGVLAAIFGLWSYLVVRAHLSYLKITHLKPLFATGISKAAVTVFVPARNEEEVIESCLNGVLGQGAIIDRVVVIDDQSTDSTPRIINRLKDREQKLLMLNAQEPEPGECGKPAALMNAYESFGSSREWLLFLDADVVLAEGAILSLLQWAESEKLDLVSGFPKLILKSPVEKLVMPSIAALIGRNYPVDKVMDPRSEFAFANGQLILVRRELYEQVGGHRVVLREVLEDVRLAEVLKSSGARLGVCNLDLLAQTRMYSSWSELREGWIKNLFLLMNSRPLKSIGWSILTMLIGGSGLLALLLLSYPFNLIAFSTVTLAQMLIRHRLGFPVMWAVLSSLASVITAYILMTSTLRHVFGGRVWWKGRQYRQT